MSYKDVISSGSKSSGHILIIDEDDHIRSTFASYLENFGYKVKMARSENEAKALLDRDMFDVALMNVCLSDYNNLDLLNIIKREHPDSEVIVCIDQSKDCDFFRVVKAGASDWIVKPCNLHELHAKLERIRMKQNHFRELSKKNLELEKIKKETEHVLSELKVRFQGENGSILPKRIKKRDDFPEIIGNSKEIESVLELVRLVAKTSSSVLIIGESGTGKELIAKPIHTLSNRSKNPFIPVNCGALTETLLESELFGHERGAFTGAVTEKRGLIEEAEGGTLFLDEIGETSSHFQVKLLRVLQEREFMRVGSSKSRYADIRVIAATNISLAEKMHQGKFREDLYYRLNQFCITIPPLRDRMDDLILLSQYFMERACSEFSKPLVGFSSELIEKMFRYTWPGNIRELENMVTSAVILATPPLIELKDMAGVIEKLHKHPRKTRLSDKTFSEAKKEFEMSYFGNILKRTNGNISAASRLSKMDRKQFREKIKKLGIYKFSYAQSF